MTLIRILPVACLIVFGGDAVFAAETDWLSPRRMNDYVQANMDGGKAYGTAISCRGTTLRNAQVRMSYTPMRGQPPFHRWQWVLAASSELDASVAKLRLSTQPQRKYRIVQKRSFVLANGKEMTCAILYR